MFRRGCRDRRRHGRHEAGWSVQYAVRITPESPWETATVLEWASCRARDISMGGVGFELFGRDVELGDTVVVDLRWTKDPVPPLRLAGVVIHKNTDRDTSGSRVGIEFVNMGDIDRILLKRLLERRDRNPYAEQARFQSK